MTRLRIAVQQDHRVALARNQVVKADTVDVGKALEDRGRLHERGRSVSPRFR